MVVHNYIFFLLFVVLKSLTTLDAHWSPVSSLIQEASDVLDEEEHEMLDEEI